MLIKVKEASISLLKTVPRMTYSDVEDNRTKHWSAVLLEITIITELDFWQKNLKLGSLDAELSH